jgi:uncharacterized damage-inducible protein DinB
MKEFFQELFAYSHSCQQRLVEIYDAHPGKISAKALLLHSHILNAHRNWNARIHPSLSLVGVWQVHDPDNFTSIDRDNYMNSLYILDHFDLGHEIDFVLSNGQALRNSVRNMLFQVVNHSTYHRAQIATELKNHDIPPLAADFIFF